MNAVRLSERALQIGGTEIEREIAQLKILAARNPERNYVLTPDHPPLVLRLAELKGVPLAEVGAQATFSISDLWNDRHRVTVIVACYNYGHFLDEAVTSVLAQSYRPDEIILSDDASLDDSAEIMRSYAERYPDLIRLNLLEQNRGIQEHFNGVIRLASGDIVMILGADNRIPADYVERLFSKLALDDSLGVAYTDFALFGGRARHDYDRMPEGFRGEKLPGGVFCTDFPQYDDRSQRLLDEGVNFIHGSSMYRKQAFVAVGGYGSRKDGPEDMNFFRAILSEGYSAAKVSEVLLEYRQHSAEQANYQFSYFGELQRLREERRFQLEEIARLRDENHVLIRENHELARSAEDLRHSRSYRLGSVLLAPLRALRRSN